MSTQNLDTTTVAAPEATTTTMAGTTTTTLEIDVEIAGGVVAGPEVFGVGLNDTVDIWVRSDVDDEIHIHGYDLYFDLEAGVPTNLSFLADAPGVFEVEVHTGHTHVFDLEVAG